MRLGTWESYSTPPVLAKELVGGIRTRAPGDAVDICAGSGNLLNAAKERWSSIELHGNDIKPPPSMQDYAWDRMDGRCFALNAVSKGLAYDLVVANPPFGDSAAPSESSSYGLLEERGRRLLHSRRIEQSMTVAAGMLVRNGGVLATIVPETIVTGPSYIELRKWLASRFHRFDLRPIERGTFKNQDLGLSFLIAYRKTNTVGIGKRAFIRIQDVTDCEFNIRRGALLSSETSSRGGTAVVHCGGAKSPDGYELRRCVNRVAAQKKQVWVAPGDLIVVRVGRRAGVVATFQHDSHAVATDCVFTVRPASRLARSSLQRIIANGNLSRRLRELVGGLGPKFLRRGDLARELSRALADSS